MCSGDGICVGYLCRTQTVFCVVKVHVMCSNGACVVIFCVVKVLNRLLRNFTTQSCTTKIHYC